MSVELLDLNAVERGVAALAGSETPSDVFRALLEHSGAGAPRAALFIVRGSQWRGWAARGYDERVAALLRRFAAPDGEGWLHEASRAVGSSWPADLGSDTPRFGQDTPDDAIGVPVHVGGKCVALLLAERRLGESPWHAEALMILAHAARLRLELDLAWRRLRATVPPAAEASVQPAPDSAAAAPPAHDPTPVQAAASEPPKDLAPWEEPEREASEVSPQAVVRRFAHVVASDIRLYNEEAVIVGRRQRDLATRLAEPMKRGEESFLRRFPDLGRDGTRVLREAYVQVLAGGDDSLIPSD